MARVCPAALPASLRLPLLFAGATRRLKTAGAVGTCLRCGCQGRFGRTGGGKARCQVAESSVEQRVTPEPSSSYEVVVVGAGQAGLAMGYLLRRQGRRFVTLERASQIAPAWRERWDSLTLFTPRRYSGLPGRPFPGDPDGYPTRDEVIAYLERYAETFELPIELHSEVKRLDLGEDGR